MASETAVKKAIAVKKQHESQWLQNSNVVSVGVGPVGKKTGIIIGVKKQPEKLREAIAENIDGVPIVIKTLRELRAL